MALTGTFKSLSDTYTYTVNIGTTRTATITDPTETSARNQIMFADDPVTITCDRQDLTKRIIISQCTINLVSDMNLTNDLYADSDRSISVTVTRGSTRCFFGYVDPLQFDQGYAQPWEEISITATDPLGALSDKNVGKLNQTSYGSGVIVSTWSLLTACLNAVGISSVTDTINSTVKSSMQNTMIAMSIFYGESEDDYMTLEDVVNEICRYWNLYVCYTGSGALIHGTINESLTSTALGSQLTIATGSDTSISVDSPYTQVNVKCDIEQQPEAVTSFTDKDSLYSDYQYGPVKYMTEYVSPGEGKTAFNAFYRMINGRDPYENYNPRNKAYMQDCYVWVKRNDAWKFNGLGHQGYVEYMGATEGTGHTSMTAPQQDILSWLKNNNYRGALVAFGKNNKVDMKDDSAQPNCSFKDCLIISINGSYQTEGASWQSMQTIINNMKTDIANAAPICEYTNINAEILSPPNANIINYLVISGQILLNPVQELSGTNWGSNAAKLTNTLQNAQNACPAWGSVAVEKLYNDSPTMTKHTVDHPDNDDGAYYQQGWYNGQGSIVNTRMGVYGDLENSKNQGLEYKYSQTNNRENWDDINKLPILECELKVGDKYCVERLDQGEQGVGKFEWMTAADASSHGLNPTFTIGINPKPGDFIIGQSHAIENNINWQQNLGGKSGTAIPIKMSDELSGEISFKVIGPCMIMWNQSTLDSWWYKDLWLNMTSIPVLTLIQSIIISDFKVETVSNNGMVWSGASNTENDLVYMSNTNETYKEKLEETVKIVTPLTDDEYHQLNIEYEPSASYVYNSDSTPFHGWGNNNTKPEECLVDFLYNEYKVPRKKISFSMKTSAIAGQNGVAMNTYMLNNKITNVYPGDSNAYRIMQYDISLKYNTMNVEFRQYEQNNSQI